MTVFAPSDVASISVPGGCGASHEVEILPGYRHGSVTCPRCEPLIVGSRTGWAHTPDGVLLTPDEIAQVEAQEAQAKREQNRTWGDPSAFARVFADALSDVRSAPAVAAAVDAGPQTVESLRAHIAGLPAAERALLAAMLTDEEDLPAIAPVEGGEPVDKADSVVDEDPPVVDEGADVASEPVKRSPGRPRKAQP